MLHGPGLFFLDDRHGGEKERQDHDQHGDDPGHEEILAFEVGVVPGPDAPVDLSVFDLPGIEFLHEFLIQPVQHELRVGDPHGGDIAHAAVHEDLDCRRLPLSDPLAEIRPNLDGEIHLSLEEETLEVPGIRGVAGDPEHRAPLQGVSQLPALLRVGLVEQRHLDVSDVGANDVPEDEDHDERGDNEYGPVLRIPEELDEFLSHEFPDPQPRHFTCPPV